MLHQVAYYTKVIKVSQFFLKKKSFPIEVYFSFENCLTNVKSFILSFFCLFFCGQFFIKNEL